MSDEIVDSECTTPDPFSPEGSSEGEPFEEASDDSQEPAPEYTGIPHDEVVDIMDIIREWHEAHGLAYTMHGVLNVYGSSLMVEHVEHGLDRTAMEWYTQFTEAHERDLHHYYSLLMFHLRAFLANLN